METMVRSVHIFDWESLFKNQRGCVLIKFSKILLPLEKFVCAFAISGLSYVKLRQPQVFITFAFKSFRMSSPFVLSSQCRRPNL